MRAALLPVLAALLALAPVGARAAELKSCAPFTLTDQYRKTHAITFPRAQPLVLLVADKEGSAQINPWIAALKERFGQTVDYAGVADVRSAPGLLHGLVRSRFQEKFTYPVMLDWTGETTDRLGATTAVTTLLVIDRGGTILGRFTGGVTAASQAAVFAVVGQSLGESATAPARKKIP